MRAHEIPCGLAVLLALSALCSQQEARAQSPDNAGSSLGTNFDYFVDWSSDYIFVDAFKASRPWLTQCTSGDPQNPNCNNSNSFDTGEEQYLDLDADGWVRSLPGNGSGRTYRSAGTLMFRGFTHYPAGQYIVLYDGQGTIYYGFGAAVDRSQSSPGRDVLNVTPTSDGIWLMIGSTDPMGTGNYIRNIRVIMPGFESNYTSQIFHPNFLNQIRRYRSLRFMNWMDTDASTQSDWPNRPRLSEARWSSGRGVPLEQLIALANRNLSDPWFNMPHMATDQYITQFATMVLNSLDPRVNVYIEYSNEVWNDAYPFSVQGQWIQQQGVAMWPSSSADSYTKRLNWYGMRVTQICDIWRSVFGAQSSRLNCIMGGQSGGDYVSSQALDCPLWTQGAPCYAHNIRALAVGPYFYVDPDNPSSNRAEMRAWTNDPDGGLGRLFTEINTGGVLSAGYPGGALKKVFDEMDGATAVARARGVGLVAYEGGQDLVDWNNEAAITNMFFAANRDPRMGAVYDRFLAGWAARSTGIMMHELDVELMDPSVGTTYGALEYLDQASSPKFDALMRFAVSAIVTGMSPTSAMVGGGGFTLTVNGSGFASGAQVTFNGAAMVTTFISSTQLTASIPGSSIAVAGIYDVKVMNPASAPGVSGVLRFAVNNPAPVCNALSPSSAVAGGPSFTLTVTGSSFLSGASIVFGGSSLPTTFVSSTQLTAQVPASILTTASTYSVGVGNPAPSAPSNLLTFSVSNPSPALASISPASATAGDPAVTLTLTGSGFVNTSQASFNAAAIATSYSSPTQLQATIPASAISTGGTFNVTVNNPAPGGGNSAAQVFTVYNPVPVLSSISPLTGLGGQAFTITANGSAFVSTSIVIFNGSRLSTTFVSSTQLRATVPASATSLPGPGFYSVAVVNPAPGGGTSSTVSYLSL